MEKLYLAVGMAIAAVAIVAGMSLLLAFPTMWAWNYAMTKVFNLPTITFWEAVALNYLSGVFFKSTINNSKK